MTPTQIDGPPRAFDAAVLAAYGWPAALTDAALMERLLALNLSRAGAGRRGPPVLLIFPPPPTTEDTHSNEGAAGRTRKEHHAR